MTEGGNRQELSGRAEPEATEAYFHRFSSAPDTVSRHLYYRPGRVPLYFSRLGMGTYRISEGVAVHQDALETAILSGCNVIDVSPAYSSGRALTLLGRVLRELTGLGQVSRNELILISGHSPPDSLEPESLRLSIDTSLQTVGLDTLDGFILRSPENHSPPNAKFLYDLQNAFDFLEEMRIAGKIQYYGISSSLFARFSPENKELHRELFRLSFPGFLMLGYPWNLVEMEFSREKREFDRRVRELGFWTFGYRPLLAKLDDATLRLAGCNPVLNREKYIREFRAAHEGLRRMEERIEQETEMRFDERFPRHSSLLADFDWTAISPELFHEMLPSIMYQSQRMIDRIRLLEKGSEISRRYSNAMNRSFYLLDKVVRLEVCRTGEILLRSYRNIVPTAPSCAAVSLGALLSGDSPATVLNGMRTHNQVKDSLSCLQLIPEDTKTTRILSAIAEKLAAKIGRRDFKKKSSLLNLEDIKNDAKPFRKET